MLPLACMWSCSLYFTYKVREYKKCCVARVWVGLCEMSVLSLQGAVAGCGVGCRLGLGCSCPCLSSIVSVRVCGCAGTACAAKPLCTSIKNQALGASISATTEGLTRPPGGGRAHGEAGCQEVSV